jgi:hypothetical protein
VYVFVSVLVGGVVKYLDVVHAVPRGNRASHLVDRLQWHILCGACAVLVECARAAHHKTAMCVPRVHVTRTSHAPAVPTR